MDNLVATSLTFKTSIRSILPVIAAVALLGVIGTLGLITLGVTLGDSLTIGELLFCGTAGGDATSFVKFFGVFSAVTELDFFAAGNAFLGAGCAAIVLTAFAAGFATGVTAFFAGFVTGLAALTAVFATGFNFFAGDFAATVLAGDLLTGRLATLVFSLAAGFGATFLSLLATALFFAGFLVTVAFIALIPKELPDTCFNNDMLLEEAA